MSEERHAECVRALVTVLRRQNATAANFKSQMKGLGFKPSEIFSALAEIDPTHPHHTDKGALEPAFTSVEHVINAAIFAQFSVAFHKVMRDVNRYRRR